MTKKAEIALKKAFGADAKISSMQAGGTMHVYLGNGEEIEKAKTEDIKKAHKKGQATITDGIKSWITHNVIYDASKEGSAAYTWDASGNKVKNKKILVTIDADGKRTEELLGTVFKNYE